MRKSTEYYCNCCGKKIENKGEVLREDLLHIEKVWGYFSEKDGERHVFDLCETCYDQMIKKFTLPVQIQEEHELL